MNIRVPVSWLREYLKCDVAAKTLANVLSLSGPSVEKIGKAGEDFLFDIEITVNRPDAFSVFGIAREAHTILASLGHKSTLTLPKGINLNLEPDTSNRLTLDVVVKSQSLCPRFTAIVVDNIKIKPSPAYIKNRLEACGIRSINNIVDISNYIMLELGQPMHTFDYDKIKGAKMVLRKSTDGEKITTIDGISRKLPEGSIVIEDSERLIDLCGIMGGENSRVSTRTKRVVVFVQAYDPQTIRKTTQALGFRTDAATRFEKGIDLEGILPALSRAVYLAKVTAGAKIASELVDIYPQKQKPAKITLNLTKLDKYLGIKLAPIKAAQILKLLGFATQITSSQITAYAPSWRASDVEDDIDLIEEIARIYGYHNLPSKLPEGQIPKTEESDLKAVIALKNALKYLGLTEVITYSIISREFLKLTGVSEKSAVELINPLTEAWQFMRPTIIPSLVKVISENRHLKSDIRLFEVAKTYLAQKNDLPKQDLFISIALQNSNFYIVKGLIENVFRVVKRRAKWQKLASNHPIFDKNQAAEVFVGDQKMGIVGLVNPKITDYFETGPIFAAELNLTTIYQQPAISNQYHPIPKYPPVIEDISAVFALVLPIAEIIDAVKSSGEPLVKKVEVVDIFEDPKLGENKKSVTLRLYFQKSSGTPTTEEANVVKEKIISHLEKEFRAKIRK